MVLKNENNVKNEGKKWRKCIWLAYYSRHSYNNLLKVKELNHYVNFDATPNALTLEIIKKPSKNHKVLHQVIKLARRNNSYNLNKPLTFLNYTENRNAFNHSLKVDFRLPVDYDLVLKSNQIVIPSEFQNHVILSTH